MNINEFFEKVYCINLDRRSDRWDCVINNFNKNNIKCERFSAKDGYEIDLPSPFRFELAGAISHLNVIKKAKVGTAVFIAGNKGKIGRVAVGSR